MKKWLKWTLGIIGVIIVICLALLAWFWPSISILSGTEGISGDTGVIPEIRPAAITCAQRRESRLALLVRARRPQTVTGHPA